MFRKIHQRKGSQVLILSRKPGEGIVIDETITVKVVRVKGNRVRIGVQASEDMRVVRGEQRRKPSAPKCEELHTGD